MKYFRQFLIPAFILALTVPCLSGNLFSGIWCVGREGLVIVFTGKDSIHVSSLKDETINGRGTYIKKGQTLDAILQKDDMQLNMGYQYQFRKDSTLEARILYFTVNGDSVDHPRRWLQMKRCDPSKGKMPTFDDEKADSTSKKKDINK